MGTKRIICAIIAAVLLAIVVGIAISVYHKNEDLRPTLEFAGAVIGGSAAVFGAFYAFLMASSSAAQKRRERSFQLIDQLNDLEMLHQRIRLAAKLEKQDPGDRPSFIRNEADREAVANHVLGIFEDLAFAIDANIADEKMLFKSLCFMVPYYWDLFQSFIMSERVQCKDDQLWENMDRLAKAWTNSKSLRTGKVFSSD